MSCCRLTSAPKYSWLGATGLASEFGASGASSKGGGAYEPLIGRALQSSALASPGSFPDGTGGVGIVQASYTSSLSEQMLQIALQHEAAQERAARLEAEAKAREEALFTECPASALSARHRHRTLMSLRSMPEVCVWTLHRRHPRVSHAMRSAEDQSVDYDDGGGVEVVSESDRGMPQNSTWRLPWRKSRITTALLRVDGRGLAITLLDDVPGSNALFFEAVTEPAAGLDEVQADEDLLAGLDVLEDQLTLRHTRADVRL
jgi:hypothetical protein